MVFKATPERKKAFEGLLSFPGLCSLLKQQAEKGTCLQFVKDIHAMRYVDGEREDVMTEPFSPIESGEAAELYEAGATFQVCANHLTQIVFVIHKMSCAIAVHSHNPSEWIRIALAALTWLARAPAAASRLPDGLFRFTNLSASMTSSGASALH